MVVKRIGAGAMGEVYRVVDKVLETDLALKRLRGASGDRFAELAREVAAAIALSHPALLRVNSLEVRGESPYILMEYVDGGSLEEFWLSKGRRLPVDEAADIVARVLDGIAFLHGRGVVHLDVKPANVLRSKAGEVKLADYGISRSLRDLLEGAGRGAGTPTYMAPEQLRGEACDGSADVYATGVMLAQLTCGTLPFAASVAAAEQWHQTADHRLPQTGTWLDGWLAKAVSLAPDDRPTAGDFAAALRSKVSIAVPASAPASVVAAATAAPVRSSDLAAGAPAAEVPAPQAPKNNSKAMTVLGILITAVGFYVQRTSCAPANKPVPTPTAAVPQVSAQPSPTGPAAAPAAPAVVTPGLLAECRARVRSSCEQVLAAARRGDARLCLVAGTSADTKEPWLNLRASSSFSSDKVAALPDGTNVYRGELVGSMWSVTVLEGRDAGQVGYAGKAFLRCP